VTADREIEIEDRQLRLTNLDRVLWPRAGFTKGDLIDYYLSLAPVLLPHLGLRPLTLGRWPRGVEGRGFAQTECRGHPAWMRTRQLRLRSGGTRNFCVVEDTASLVWIVNLCTIEFHAYPFTFDSPDEPIVALLDLDPGPNAGLLQACWVALLLRDALNERDLSAYPKTTGAAGLHLHIPLGQPTPGERTRELARGLAAELASSHGDLVTDRPRAQREGKVLIDWLASDPRRSAVVPYSLRATERPSVSAPLLWSEVEDAVKRGDDRPLHFAPAEIETRIAAGFEWMPTTISPL
jgi:bifunctional non-homologous end joining protein LigD